MGEATSALASSAVVDSAEWIERDVARVWHGFTQMAAYADNRPVIVERAEGRELIDVEGRRYLDASAGSSAVVSIGQNRLSLISGSTLKSMINPRARL